MNLQNIAQKVAELEMAAMEFALASDKAIRLEKAGAKGFEMEYAKKGFDRTWERLKATRLEVYGENAIPSESDK